MSVVALTKVVGNGSARVSKISSQHSWHAWGAAAVKLALGSSARTYLSSTPPASLASYFLMDTNPPFEMLTVELGLVG